MNQLELVRAGAGAGKTYNLCEIVAEAANVLNRQFDQSTGPNQTWVSDITYVWTNQGWLHLACVVDLYSRRVVCWSMSLQKTKELVLDALQMAIIRRCLKGSLLHHSERGSQYCSEEY